MPGVSVLAVDLGGSHAACALVDGKDIVVRRDVPVSDSSSLETLLPVLADSLKECLRSAGRSAKDCAAVVLGFCGIASARENKVLATNGKFDDATHLDLQGWSEQAFDLPFLVENDARLALLGEHRFGAARGAQDAVMITLGTGVGGAALLNGRLVQSRHGLAGTIGGHLPVVVDGRLCSCGNLGCAEAESSTAFLPAIYRERSGSEAGLLAGKETIGFAELFEAVEAGDRPAQAALDRCLRVWSTLTVALIHAYDPEIVLFGGAVLKRADSILPRLQDYVKAHAWTPGRTVPLRAADLGSDAALLGAVALAEDSL